jgi:DNA-binding MarR family transcriptional regulator
MPQNQDHIRRILDELDARSELSQRALASRLGIALGRANQLVRTLIQQNWIRGVPHGGHRMRYLLTPQGAEARVRMSRDHLRHALAWYGPVRDRVRERLEACMPAEPSERPDDQQPAVVLYGTGEVAQIAFACAAELGVRLVGFVDDGPREVFLGLPVRPSNQLTAVALDGEPFDWLLVASLSDHEGIRGRLEGLGFPLDRVTWI